MQAVALLSDPDTISIMQQLGKTFQQNDPSTNILCHVDAARCMNQAVMAVVQEVQAQTVKESAVLEVVIRKALPPYNRHLVYVVMPIF